MRRRVFLLRLMAGGAAVALGGRIARLAALPLAQSALPPTFSEAVMMSAVTPDGSQEVFVRLERFPARERGALSVLVSFGDEVYAVAADDLDLGGPPIRTPVEAPRASFEISGALISEFSRTIDAGSMTGTVHVSALVHALSDPPPGIGTSPLLVEATFKSWHRPVALSEGWRETLGQVHARIHSLKGAHEVSASGSWGEQVGDRSGAEARFTYLTAQGQDTGLVAEPAAGVPGCAWIDGKVTMIRACQVDPPGPARRSFRAEPDDGRSITGTAEVRREHSLLIDGHRRPAATVVVSTSVGPMTGHLID